MGDRQWQRRHNQPRCAKRQNQHRARAAFHIYRLPLQGFSTLTAPMHPFHHAKSSVRKYGGKVEDYIPIHSWFDESKSYHATFRHRALRHHAEGIFMAEQIFGVTIRNADGKEIPTRFIGEQHVQEDLGFIPSVSDWLKHIKPKPWMLKANMRSKDVDKN